MKKFLVNKKIDQKPYVLNLPVNIGYIFFAVTLVLIFILLAGFSFKKLLILVGVDIMVYLVLSFVGEKSIARIQKEFFAQKIKVIKNNSLEPFKNDIND